MGAFQPLVLSARLDMSPSSRTFSQSLNLGTCMPFVVPSGDASAGGPPPDTTDSVQVPKFKDSKKLLKGDHISSLAERTTSWNAPATTHGKPRRGGAAKAPASRARANVRSGRITGAHTERRSMVTLVGALVARTSIYKYFVICLIGVRVR